MFTACETEFWERELRFAVPENFTWVYPTGCGHCVADGEGAPAMESGGLVLYILEGTGVVRYGGESRVYRPDCVIAVRDAPELVLCPEETTEFFYLRAQNADALIERIGENGFVTAIAKDSGADHMFEKFCHEAKTNQMGNIYTASAGAFSLLLELCGKCENGGGYSALVQQAVDLIRREYAFIGGIDELADTLGVTQNHLIRCFTAQTGRSPGKYLQAVKVDNAKLMLQNRDYSIEMIANMTGYSGANYFCKVFRRVTGESPGQYRARHMAAPDLDPGKKRMLEELDGISYI